MPYITTPRDIQWNYRLLGRGEPLVFLHGWGVDSGVWTQQTEYFSGKYQVMTMDLPGHGRTSWKNLSLEKIAQDLDAVMENLGLRGINAVGSSLGGLVALKLWELFPRRIRRMVWVGCLPKFLQSPDYPFGVKKEWIKKLDGQLETDYPAVVHIFLRSLFTQAEREAPRFRWLKQFRRTEGFPLRAALRGFLNILEKEDLSASFSKLNVPFQIMNGTDDYICSAEAVNFFEKKLPQARVGFLRDCGHFPFLTKPQEFNQMLEEFLRAT